MISNSNTTHCYIIRIYNIYIRRYYTRMRLYLIHNKLTLQQIIIQYTSIAIFYCRGINSQIHCTNPFNSVPSMHIYMRVQRTYERKSWSMFCRSPSNLSIFILILHMSAIIVGRFSFVHWPYLGVTIVLRKFPYNFTLRNNIDLWSKIHPVDLPHIHHHTYYIYLSMCTVLLSQSTFLRALKQWTMNNKRYNRFTFSDIWWFERIWIWCKFESTRSLPHPLPKSTFLKYVLHLKPRNVC